MKDFFSQDFDKTVTAVGAVVLAFYIVSKVFGLHDTEGNNSIISPEIIMAIINIPTAFLAFAIGKKVGESSNGSETKNRDTEVASNGGNDPPPGTDN